MNADVEARLIWPWNALPPMPPVGVPAAVICSVPPVTATSAPLAVAVLRTRAAVPVAFMTPCCVLLPTTMLLAAVSVNVWSAQPTVSST